MIKTIIFKGIIWNSLFIMFLCENYSVKPNEHWTSSLGQGHGEE